MIIGSRALSALLEEYESQAPYHEKQNMRLFRQWCRDRYGIVMVNSSQWELEDPKLGTLFLLNYGHLV